MGMRTLRPLPTSGETQAPPRSGASLWQQLREQLDPGRIRPTALPGIQAFPLHTRKGEEYVIVRNPTASAYLHLVPWQYDLLTALDGTHTIKDLLLRNFQAQGVLELNGITSLVATLRTYGFVQAPQADMYSTLGARLGRTSRYRLFLRRSVMIVSGVWRVRAIEAASRTLCRTLAPVFRRYLLWLLVLLAVAGVILPLVEVFGLQRGFAATAGNACVMLLTLWCAGVVYTLADGIAVAARGRLPLRAGIHMLAGIPLPWIDAREALTAGPDGALLVWWAGPGSMLVCAGVLSGVALALQAALVAALSCALLGIAALGPPFALSGRGLTSHAWNLHDLRTHPWSVRPGTWPLLRIGRQPPGTARRAFLLFDALTVLWIGLAAAELAAFLRAGLGILPATLWDSLTLAGHMLLVLLLVYLAGCATLQYALPVIRRQPAFGPLSRALVKRYKARGLGERLAVMRTSTVLGSLTEEQMVALAREAEEARYPDGFDVVVQGEMGTELSIVMEGTACLIDEGGPTVLETLRHGQGFGQQAMLYHGLSNATMRATSDLRLLRIGRAAFDTYLAPRLLLEERLAALQHERQALASVPMLASLGPEALNLLLPRLIVEHFEPRGVIIRQGEQGETFYIIRSGTVEILDERHDPPRRLNVLGTGAYFGEQALLYDRPRNATVRALVEVSVWRLSRTDFDLVLSRYLGVGGGLNAEVQRIEARRLLSA
jgi:CRP-like cAMP-binding protein